MVWKLIRGRLVQVGIEILFVTGVMTFSRQLLELLLPSSTTLGLQPQTLVYAFWSAIAIIVLIPLVAVWRNISAMAMILAEGIGNTWAPASLVQSGVKAMMAVALGYWIYAIIPADQLGVWGWIAIAAAAAVAVAVFSGRLIYWHSQWQTSVRDVLAEDPRGAAVVAAEKVKDQRERDLQDWDVRLMECVVPDGASYGGQTLAELSIPARFGCAVLEVERNGIVITAVRPDLRLYPGDKLLLMGKDEELDAAQEFMTQSRTARDQSDEFRGSVLETSEIPRGPHGGRTLAELNLGQTTGARVVGIRRGEVQIIAPSGQERLEAGDSVLVAGTLAEIAAFHRWLKQQK